MGANFAHVGSRLTTLQWMLEPATLTNFTVRFRPVGSRVSLAACIYNVFDVGYAHPVGAEFRQDSLVQAGRSASARVVFGF